MNGYILVVNVSDDHEIVKKHGLLFDELQYFGSHRVVEYNAWAKFVNQELVHAYAYLGERGEIQWNEGKITEEEVKLGFDKFPVLEITGEDDEIYPDEDDVIEIAKEWGVDPTFENQNYEKSKGFVCRF